MRRRSATPAMRASAQKALLPRLWEFLGLGPLAAFAAAAASAILVAVSGAPEPALVAILQSPDGARPGYVLEVAADRTVRLVPLAATPVPSGHALQFWTKADADPGPTSLGLLVPDAAAALPFPGTMPAPGQLFEVTLEPATGSPIGRPTGPILFIGRAVPGDAV